MSANVPSALIHQTPLTRKALDGIIFFVNAASASSHDQPESTPKTLGDLLYSNKDKIPVPESEWVNVLKAIAAGDQAALHSLYQRTHRLVFTLIVRITNSRETAEELTIDVFHDVWQIGRHTSELQ